MAHKESAELLSDLDKLKQLVKIGDPFECPGFPDIDYVVTNLGFIEETEEPCIIYKKREDGQTSWVRTLSEYVNKDVLRTDKNKDQLLEELNKLKLRIDEGDKCYHYKHPDQLYQIVGVGFIERNGQPCVVYQAEYGDQLTWVRIDEEFFAKVDLEGTQVNRFTKVV
ncbi:MAG: DUF1653 domain-containing protein [Patescibacteria group bacterium]